MHSINHFDSTKIDLTNLQQNLQGSVKAGVNGGPCE
jgi:hypothetical protein